MNAPSDSSGKSTPPDLFDVVENIRTKAKSQIKTANMIGKFVTPILRRKITAFVNEQVGSLTGASAKPGPKSSGTSSPTATSATSATSPAAATKRPTPATPTSASRKRPTGDTATSRAGSADAVATRSTATKPTGRKPTEAKPSAAKSSATKSSATKSSAAAKPSATKPSAAATPSKTPSRSVAKPPTTRGAKPVPSPKKQTSVTTATSTKRPPTGDRELTENPLGIDGYDGLPSSSIVPLLDGLSQPQLRAVEAYEQANRARRTVLHRAKQLQSS